MSKRVSKGGKRKIKMALLEIHTNDSDTNDNGIHWKNEYILNNLDSAEGMPICCEFTDDTKTVPLGHGFTGIESTENQPLFENSEVVGSIRNAYPQTVEIDGVKKQVLIGEGCLYQQRYPSFVKWLADSLAEGKVFSSIEITGKPENGNNIVYEETEISDDYRTPKDFVFSGTAVLSVEPADKSALILQMNNLTKGKENTMDEKVIALIVDSVKQAITETIAKNAEYEKEIEELNENVEKKASEVNSLNEEITAVKTAIHDLEVERDSWYAERETLNKMLGELKAKQRIAELDKALEEFTDEQKEYANNEIAEFEKDPEAVEINSIIAKIHEGIGRKFLKDSKNPAVRNAETNSATNDYDIYGDIGNVKSEKIETVDIYGSIY